MSRGERIKGRKEEKAGKEKNKQIKIKEGKKTKNKKRTKYNPFSYIFYVFEHNFSSSIYYLFSTSEKKKFSHPKQFFFSLSYDFNFSDGYRRRQCGLWGRPNHHHTQIVF